MGYVPYATSTTDSIDCFEAAKEWRDILAVHLDEPGDFEAFKVFSGWMTFGLCLAVLRMPAAWGAADMTISAVPWDQPMAT